MEEKTVTFVGKTWGDCRFQWSQLCDSLMPREPFMTHADAHRTSDGGYQITFRYLPEVPEDAQ
jgi:hypothetical protein